MWERSLTNNYYPMYKSQFVVDDVLEAAAANGC
jgi:hypothetical protein